MIDPAGTVEVAILDTGVDASHPDLAGKLAGGATTDPHGHGTWMAGIVAAATNNGIGIAGVGYDGVSVLPIAVLDADGTGYDAAIIDGLAAATAAGADVVLMAFSSPDQSTALQTAIDAARAAGVVVVASVGNDGSTAASYPAGYPGVIGVAATDQDDGLASFSNSGASAFIAAPGTGHRDPRPRWRHDDPSTAPPRPPPTWPALPRSCSPTARHRRRGRPPRPAPPTPTSVRPRPPRPGRRARRSRHRRRCPSGDLSGPEGDADLQGRRPTSAPTTSAPTTTATDTPPTATRAATGSTATSGNNSTYFEGDATVQRLWLTGLAPGTAHASRSSTARPRAASTPTTS